MRRRKQSTEGKPQGHILEKVNTGSEAKTQLAPKKVSMTLLLFAAILTCVIERQESLARGQGNPEIHQIKEV